jgi:hypothetical protein
LEEQGYDGLDILLSLSEEELEELASTLKMKKGHRIRLPLAVSKARQRAAEALIVAAEEKKKQKKKEEQKAKQDEEDALEERKIAKELADIETERKLAKARSTRVVESEVEEKESFTNPKGFSFTMPPGKNHFAFLSHKKTNSKLLGNTETLALRVRSFALSFLFFVLM